MIYQSSSLSIFRDHAISTEHTQIQTVSDMHPSPPLEFSVFGDVSLKPRLFASKFSAWYNKCALSQTNSRICINLFVSIREDRSDTRCRHHSHWGSGDDSTERKCLLSAIKEDHKFVDVLFTLQHKLMFTNHSHQKLIASNMLQRNTGQTPLKKTFLKPYDQVKSK